jgi:hypothetical protein
LFTINVPELIITTSSTAQLSIADWIAPESSLPLGERVAQMVVLFIIPPLDIIPGFQAKILSGGSTGEGGGGGGGGGRGGGGGGLATGVRVA